MIEVQTEEPSGLEGMVLIWSRRLLGSRVLLTLMIDLYFQPLAEMDENEEEACLT